MTAKLFDHIGISALELILAGWASILDWRFRRIPNWLTVPALLSGFLISALLGGWPGLKASLEGAGLALGLLLPFVLARGLGAGDWKLMGALGAFLGPLHLAVVLFGTVLIAGLMAMVQMIVNRRVKETLWNLLVLIHAFATFHMVPTKAISLENPKLMKLPFAVAAALSMVTFFCVKSAFKIL